MTGQNVEVADTKGSLPMIGLNEIQTEYSARNLTRKT